MNRSRRGFPAAGTGTAGAPLGSPCGPTQSLDTGAQVDDPLTPRPNRDWRKVGHGTYADDGVDWIPRGGEGGPGPGSTGGYEGRGEDEFGAR